MFRNTPAGATLTVRVTPRAGRSAIAGMRDDVLLVKLAAPPVDGAANDALIRLLADLLDVPPRDVSITAGARGRTKQVAIAGRSAAVLDARLARLTGAR